MEYAKKEREREGISACLYGGGRGEPARAVG